MPVLRKRGGIILAETVLKSIENGEDIDLDDSVTISGSLDLNLCNLPEITSQCLRGSAKIISSSISINNSKIKGYVDFSNSWFQKPLILRSNDFMSHVDFSNSKFFEDNALTGSVFSSEHATRFTNTTFFKKVYINGVSFKVVDFKMAKFYAIAEFNGSNFNYSYFDNVNFMEEPVILMPNLMVLRFSPTHALRIRSIPLNGYFR
jgi:uncharacterized protein YjbI with pentapeptide repeats